MTAQYLENITIQFPNIASGFISCLSTLLRPLSLENENGYTVIPSNEYYLPKISMNSSSEKAYTTVDFMMTHYETISVNIQNISDINKKSPSIYTPIELTDVIDRLHKNGVEILDTDHIGFNLPWFNKGLHPAIRDLRNRLKAICLYHSFPTGEPWDFILPGDSAEIRKRKAIDYNQVRKPKFEIVSFDKASTPLIQIDSTLNTDYADFRHLFPEALDDQKMKNIWIYLINPCEVDVCLVLNEYKEDDWSFFFKGHRL